jgi:hypothetical protein
MREFVDAGALAAPHNPSGYDPVMDGGAEIATARATAAIEAGRPLRPTERREVRRTVLAEQAGAQPAGQPQRRRPSVREWLEAMSPEQRAEFEFTERFQQLSEQAQAHVLRVRESVDAVEEEAEYRHQLYLEDEAVSEHQANIEPEGEWAEEEEPPDFYELAGLDRLDRESAQVNADWEIEEEDE